MPAGNHGANFTQLETPLKEEAVAVLSRRLDKASLPIEKGAELELSLEGVEFRIRRGL